MLLISYSYKPIQDDIWWKNRELICSTISKAPLDYKQVWNNMIRYSQPFYDEIVNIIVDQIDEINYKKY